MAIEKLKNKRKNRTRSQYFELTKTARQYRSSYIAKLSATFALGRHLGSSSIQGGLKHRVIVAQELPERGVKTHLVNNLNHEGTSVPKRFAKRQFIVGLQRELCNSAVRLREHAVHEIVGNGLIIH